MLIGILRFLSIFTDKIFFVLVSNSTQEPLEGINYALAKGLPEIGSLVALK